MGPRKRTIGDFSSAAAATSTSVPPNVAAITLGSIVGFDMTSLKLSILPRFYFHDVLEQLKTNFHTNFRFKRVLGFVIEYV